MKIEEFVELLNSFDKLFIGMPEPFNQTGELPCFERISPYVKYSKAEFSNDSIDMYVGYIENGKVHLNLEGNEEEILGMAEYQCTQYMNKKIFIEAKPISKELAMVCFTDELYKFKETDIFITSKLIGETFPDAHRVIIDLTKVTFDHYNNGDPDYEKLAGYSYELTKMKANLKVVKWFVDKFGMEEVKDRYKRLSMDYSPEQLEILKKNRINDYGFSPIPVYGKKLAPITIKIGGFSNLPKVDDVLKRIETNKQQTTAGKVMKPMVEKISGLDENKKADILITYNELAEKISNTQERIRKLTYNVILKEKLASKSEIVYKKDVLYDGNEISIEMKVSDDK